MRRRDLLRGLAAGFAGFGLSAAEASSPLSDHYRAEDDLLIVGSGGAGLMAALSALQNGAPHVTVLEKAPMAGGRTLYSSGFLSAVSPRRQVKRPAFGHDSIERMVREMQTEGGHEGDPVLIETLVRDSESVLDVFERLGLRWRAPVEYSGAYYPRSFTPYPMRSGFEYVRSLLAALRASPARCTIRYRVRAKALRMEKGRIAGLDVETPDGPDFLPARAVILATGGFAANSELLRCHCGDAVAAGPKIVSTPDAVDTGDGLLMAQALGADAVGLEHVLSVPYMGGKVHWTTGSDIYLTPEGRRFIAEGESWRALRDAVRKLPARRFWIVTDARSFKGDSAEMKMLEGRVRTAASVEALALGMKMPLSVLSDTLSRYNGFVLSGEDADFGKRTLAQTIEAPPFYYGEETLGLLVTLGGLRINRHAEVLRSDGTFLPGLYAAGETTGGIHGISPLGGATLTDIFVFGRRAGRSAARVFL